MSEEANTLEALEERIRLNEAQAAAKVQELVATLGRVPEARAREALELAARSLGPDVVPLLEGAASAAQGAVALAVLRALGMVRDPAAAEALQRLGSTLEGEARKAARRELHRLTTLGVTPGRAPGRPAGLTPAREEHCQIYRALAGFIAGDGTRTLWMGLEEGGDFRVLALLLNDERGILEARGGPYSRTRFDRDADEQQQDEEQPSVEVPADYCRRLVEEAHARNAATRTALPRDYLAWHDCIGRPEQTYDRPLVYGVLNSLEVRWNPQYLERSAELLDLPLFATWALPHDEMAEYEGELAAAKKTGLVLPATGGQIPGGIVVDRATQRLFDPRRRALLKRRLEEMAYFLWKKEQAFQARAALAAAMALDPPDLPLQGHPFARTMIERSLGLKKEEVHPARVRQASPGSRLVLPY